MENFQSLDYLEELEDINNPLKEKYFNTPKYKEYLYHNKFHHSEKGCQIEMKIVERSKDRHIAINKYCKTHQKICSKTGWELGWYLGNNNRYKECIICKVPIKGKSILKKYCDSCLEVRRNNCIKNKKQELLTKME